MLLLTGVWHRIKVREFRWSLYKRGVKTYLYVDLWSIDANTLKPRWRRRLASIENGARTGKALLGADGQTVWLYMDGPLAISARDWRVLADSKGLEARNPQLGGLLLDEEKHYGFDAAGLWLMSADARRWRVDAALKATPLGAQERARESVTLPAVTGPGTAIQYIQLRGMHIGERWLGVLSTEEAAQLEVIQREGEKDPMGRAKLAAHLTSMTRRGGLPAHANVRNRLWQARVQQVSAAPSGWPAELPSWGTRDTYADLAPLPEGPEFLNGGLLVRDIKVDVPLFLTKPDSVLVLHQQRLGDDGPLALARIAGPHGRVVWNRPLPLTQLYAVLPGDKTLLLSGGYFRPKGEAYESRDHDAGNHVVGVDLTSGALTTLDFTGAALDVPITADPDAGAGD
ncbi:MAG TPA: PA2928 family protein [Xanthomonadaceae bacterium]|nr:PA2928 family protein [Xanthomonadaceae bacterium]